jgi:CheY-like chemotaxis protein
MSETQRSVLFIGFDAPTFSRISSYAERKGFFADRVENPRDALELLTLLPFDALVLAHPLSDLTVRFLLQAIRRPESLNLTAGVVVVLDPSHSSETAELVEQGANAVISTEDAPAQLPKVLRQLTQVAPRRPMRLTSRVHATLGVVDVQSLCQTVNLSKSGMLLRGDQVIPVGTEIFFEIQLPTDAKPVRGHGRVMRHTFERKERVAGLGVAFLGFEESDDLRLWKFLETQWLG